ncbi:unnamed protein product [Haemonchus placei]|uniref:UDENN domain-containing protein n=1 Tax=Haemonchus placei TaxID=6290 RepID=A0A0N4WEP9_HAEPC|nr:unnamed protein product [Haemonchus placei]
MQTTSEKGWVVFRLQLYAIYLVLQTIYRKLLEVVYLCTGSREIPDGKVRVSSIVWRYKVDPEEIAKRKDFVLAPGYLDSIEILNNPQWAIYTIEKDLVIFVLLPEPITTYTIDKNPFLFVPMFEKEVRTLLHATVTCLRAHLPVETLCVLKTQSFEARLVPLCKDIPNLKHIFMFRKKALISVEKAARRAEFLYLLLLELYKYSPYVSRCLGTLVAGEGKWVRILRPDDMRGQAAIMLASPLSYYEKNKEMYCHPIVWFHEVIHDTEKVLTSVFNEIGIPLSCVADAVECKKEDSQKGSFLSQQSLKHLEVPPISKDDRAMLDSYAVRMGVPLDVFETD